MGRWRSYLLPKSLKIVPDDVLRIRGRLGAGLCFSDRVAPLFDGGWR